MKQHPKENYLQAWKSTQEWVLRHDGRGAGGRVAAATCWAHKKYF